MPNKIKQVSSFKFTLFANRVNRKQNLRLLGSCLFSQTFGINLLVSRGSGLLLDLRFLTGLLSTLLGI